MTSDSLLTGIGVVGRYHGRSSFIAQNENYFLKNILNQTKPFLTTF